MAATVINGKGYTVSDIMRAPILVSSSSTLRDVLAVLIEQKSNICVVVDESGKFIGTVSTVDIIRAILPDYLENDEVAARFAGDAMLKEDAHKAAELPVCDFVDKDERKLDADVSLIEAAVIVVQDGVGRVVVVDENQHPLGVLTRTEVKKALAAFLDIKNELE